MGEGLTTEEIDPERRRIARALRLLMNKYYKTLRISFVMPQRILRLQNSDVIVIPIRLITVRYCIKILTFPC